MTNEERVFVMEALCDEREVQASYGEFFVVTLADGEKAYAKTIKEALSWDETGSKISDKKVTGYLYRVIASHNGATDYFDRRG